MTSTFNSVHIHWLFCRTFSIETLQTGALLRNSAFSNSEPEGRRVPGRDDGVCLSAS